LKPEKTRNGLFTKLNTVLSLSEEKFKVNNKKDETRLKWGRLMVQAIQVYGKLLETVELDQIMTEIEAIKKHVGMTT